MQLTWKDLQWLWDVHFISVNDVLATPGLEDFELISDDSDEERQPRERVYQPREESRQSSSVRFADDLNVFGRSSLHISPRNDIEESKGGFELGHNDYGSA